MVKTRAMTNKPMEEKSDLGLHPIKQYNPDRMTVLDGMKLTLAEYVGAAGAAVTFGKELPRTSGTSPGARGGASSKKSVRFTPGTPASEFGDNEGPVVPDSKQLWRMPPPAHFSYDWTFKAPAQVIVHGVDVNKKGATSVMPRSQPPSARASAPDDGASGRLPPIEMLSPVERKRRRRIERNRRSLRTPWLPAAGHVRRAPVASNGAYLFPHASSSLLAKSVKRKRDKKLKVELRQLERELVADAPKTHTESEHRGRIIGDMLDLREELVRTIASPWAPRMGRCR